MVERLVLPSLPRLERARLASMQVSEAMTAALDRLSERLGEIRAYVEAATAGPWEFGPDALNSPDEWGLLHSPDLIVLATAIKYDGEEDGRPVYILLAKRSYVSIHRGSGDSK